MNFFTKNKLFFSSLILLGLFILICNYVVVSSSKESLFDDVNEIPFCKYGLVLGTSKNIGDNVINPYYTYRIDAASELYFANKVKYLLVSADSSLVNNNQSRDMKVDLMIKGVPTERIFVDPHSTRTLDSFIRAKEIYGLDSMTIISQAFHNKRATFLANNLGMKTVSFNARPVKVFKYYLPNFLRESLARVKAILDIVFGVEAFYMGEKVDLP